MWYSRKDLRPQYQWAGVKLQNLELYVCTRTCLDLPQEQLRAIVIPPDPVPVYRPFPEQFEQTVPSYIATQPPEFDTGSVDITTEDGNPLISEIADTPTPDPDNPVIYPPP